MPLRIVTVVSGSLLLWSMQATVENPIFGDDLHPGSFQNLLQPITDMLGNFLGGRVETSNMSVDFVEKADTILQ